MYLYWLSVDFMRNSWIMGRFVVATVLRRFNVKYEANVRFM